MTADPRFRWIRDLIQREDYAHAWPMASELLNEKPDDPKALYLVGWCMRQMDHVGAALQLFRRALSLEPDNVNLWMHFGACLHDTHQYKDAREAFHRVAKALPTDPMPIGNIAASYVQEGHCNEALKYANRALAMDPKHKIASLAKSFASLGLGRWADGWEHAEQLYGDALRIRVYNPPEREEPMWDGSPGKTVVVQADQGLGDMIMFAQCLTDMQRDCKKVIVETNSRLAGMFRRNFPGIDVYATLKDDHAEWPVRYVIDAHIHISWLGKFYRKTNDDFPRRAYLQADEIKREKWRAWLGQFPRPWVGIAWKGGIPRTNTVARSMELADLAPIIRAGGTPISLAYQDVGIEIARWNIADHTQVVVPEIDNAGDYDETLALIAELDHVVTVTTTVAHACGAMGKRAYVLVNDVPAWRYCYHPNDTLLWYPENSVRLYQQKHGEIGWSHVVARAARDFESFVMPLTRAA
jgi:tetratricopeptide (TPR) repeat protein